MNNKEYLIYKQNLDGYWKLYIESNEKVRNDGFELNKNNKLEQSGYLCIDGKVPGNFELDMMREGIIEDLFFGENILEAQKLENRHLWYSRTFDYDLDDIDNLYLRFDGIDTFSEIYLNGDLIAKTDNMFIQHEIPLSNIKKGNNEIVVHILPTTIIARQFPCGAGATVHLDYNAESLAVRKAAHMFGWDIMPRIMSAGIWKSVSLVKKPSERLEEFYLYTLDANHDEANLYYYYQLDVTKDFIKDYTIKISGQCRDSKFETERVCWSAYGTYKINIKNPHLWWIKNKGNPDLYNVRVELFYKDVLCDVREFKFGIREVKLIRTSIIDDNNNGDFRIKLNGEDVFICGTNWVPLDAFHSRDLQRLPKALELLNDIGCNMVRCWGGNVYESEEFFDFCDEHGIAIWQDFGMGCATYPQTKQLAEMLEKEVAVTVKSFRQHTSIFLWAGDNECDIATYWREISQTPNDNKLTREIIPTILHNIDPIRPYLPSSPYVDEVAEKIADRKLPEDHLWGPRDYYKSQFYSTALTRFASEIGYHGCPAPSSIKKFISSNKIWPPLDNKEWLIHATCMETTKNCAYSFRIKLMSDQIKTLFGKDMDNINDYATASQISQAEAYKYFIEHFRYEKPMRTGIIWWNLIDGWPQFSDAVVDYYYKPKFAYFAIKRSQQPVCLMFKEPNSQGELQLVAVNELNEDVNIRYKIEELTKDTLILEGNTTAFANIVTDIKRISNKNDEFRFYLITWTSKYAKGENHYIAGKPTYNYETLVNCFKKSGLLKMDTIE